MKKSKRIENYGKSIRKMVFVYDKLEDDINTKYWLVSILLLKNPLWTNK